MAEIITGWTFFGVWLTAALWTVLDAEARGRNAFIWGGLTFIFGPFALGAYAITGERDAANYSAERRRTYYFAASYFFLGGVYACLVGLFSVAVEAGLARESIDSEAARILTAVLLATLFFAAPLWGFHWNRCLGLLEIQVSDEEDRSLFFIARRYGTLVLVIDGLLTLAFGVFLMFSLFAALLGVFEGGRDSFLVVLAFLPPTILVMLFHYVAIFRSPHYQALAARFEAVGTAASETPSETSGTI